MENEGDIRKKKNLKNAGITNTHTHTHTHRKKKIRSGEKHCANSNNITSVPKKKKM